MIPATAQQSSSTDALPQQPSAEPQFDFSVDDFVHTSAFDSQHFSSSHFVHDFLTPEYSSETHYSIVSAETTPSIEDVVWEQNGANSVAHKQTEISEYLVGFDPTTAREGEDLYLPSIGNPKDTQILASTIAPTLLSPQLTNTPSPPNPSHGQHQLGPMTEPRVTSTAESGSNIRTPGHAGRPSGSQGADSGYDTTSGLTLQPTSPTPYTGAMSPVVMVSSYDRNEYPMQSEFIPARSPSKRSRTSDSSQNNGLESSLINNDNAAITGAHQEEVKHTHMPRTLDGAWITDAVSGQTGVLPHHRSSDNVPSINQLEEQRQLDEKNAEVETWLAKSEASSGDDDGPSPKTSQQKSTSNKHNTIESATDQINFGTPGPGILVDEESGSDSSEGYSYEPSDPETAAPPDVVNLDQTVASEGYFAPTDGIPSELEEPLPSQFYRAKPWQDPVTNPVYDGEKSQPVSSNSAMMKFEQQAAKFETASRAATWGTRRRLSEADVNSIIGEQGKFEELSLQKQKSRERGSSFINKARGLVPRRSSSHAKKRPAEPPSEQSGSNYLQKPRGESLGSIHAMQRMQSLGKASKSPPLDTGRALMAMTGQLTAVGRSTSAAPEARPPSRSTWQSLSRQRSKSEMPKFSGKASANPGLTELITQYGGPPIPTLISPMQERQSIDKRSEDDEAEEEDYQATIDKGTKMDFRMRAEITVPDPAGFKAHALKLNPCVEPFLLERVGQEQNRRYKKLMENKVKHTNTVQRLKSCSSGKHCFELGGEATLLPPRPSAKDPETTHQTFHVSTGADSDGDGAPFAEGIVSAALFPPGIPLPPVKRLPAEFECLLCFKVKKFQKPSDWTKHVHEDVQPFTCTFPHCIDSKSFKRKADWVRHENERHRHLEWWTCNMPECNHICYRKDNFVQHLVREHKKPEPKVKTRGSGSSKTKLLSKGGSLDPWQTQGQDHEIDEIWRLVEACHCETRKESKEETCKFCGNVCGSWKKLTVHLAKHMEQIAMPVLDLVKQRDVSPDTVISPMEAPYQSALVPLSPHMAIKPDSNGPSPRSIHSAPQYQGPSAAPSPASSNSFYQPSHLANEEAYLGGQAGAPQPPPSMAEFARVHRLPMNISYGPYQGEFQPHRFTPGPATVPITYPQPQHPIRHGHLQASPRIPRSHPAQQPPFQTSVGDVHTGLYAHQHNLPMYSSPVEALDYNPQFYPTMTQTYETGHSMVGPAFDGQVSAAEPMVNDEMNEAQPTIPYSGGYTTVPHPPNYAYE